MMPLHLRIAFGVFVVYALGIAAPALSQSTENGQSPSVGKPQRPIKPGAIIVRAQGRSRALEVITTILKAFPQGDQYDVRGDDKAFLPRFCDSDAPFDMLVTSDLSLARGEGWALSARFPAEQPQPLKIPIGQLRVLLVVSTSNPVEAIELSKIRELLRSDAKGRSWNELLGNGPSGGVKCYGPSPNAPALAIIRKMCMEHWEKVGQYARQLHIDSFRSDVQECDSAQAVLKGVRSAHLTGLGIVDFPGAASAKWTGLKPLAIGVDPSTSVRPDLAPVIQLDYPLAETITLYIHPKAIAQTEGFVRFCVSREGAEICAKFGLISPWYETQELARKRLAEVKAGKGTEIVVCDLAGQEDVLKDLSSEFVKAKAAVQLRFVRGQGSEVRGQGKADEAFEKLSKGAADLLLADRNSGEWRGESGEGPTKSEIPNPKPAEKGTVPGTLQGEGQSPIPRSIELGRMAVGVIVHPENPLDSLPLDEAKSIFCGEVKKWPAVRGAAAAMHVFGLRNTNPTTQLLKEKLTTVGSGQWSVGSGQSRPASPASRPLKYSAQPDNEKVILAVARDPAAIGFVDMSQLPPNEKSVKLVQVLLPGQLLAKQVPAKDTKEAKGKKAKNKARGGKKDASEEVAANAKPEIPSPLARTLTLYVSPKASQVAKDFADFLTPEHCRETIAQHNLLPPLHAEEASRLVSRPHPGPLPKGEGTWGKPLLEGEGMIDLASADEPIPPLLDDPDAPQDQGRTKPKKLAAKPEPVIPAPEQPAPPKVTTDTQPAPETESEPAPTKGHPGAPSLTDEQIVWLVGGIAGVVLLALGVGWLQAPHRKRKRR